MMEIKNRWKKGLYMTAIFLFIYFLPVDIATFNEAVIDALRLARWYAREHVILCLLPAFFIAGAVAVFLNKDAIIKYLGPGANKIVAYGVASVSGSVLAVCSCTVLPLFAGIYKTGAGLGPATAFLYSGPAINVLAIILTARVLGLKLGIARALGAVIFSIVIGLLMHLIFLHEEKEEPARFQQPDSESRPLWQTVIYFVLMVGLLVSATWGAPQTSEGFWYLIYSYKWYLTAAFAFGIGVALVGWFGLEVWKLVVAVFLLGITAAVFPAYPQLVFGVGILILIWITETSGDKLADWADESWGFALQILPLLLIGVLIAGLFFGVPGQEGGLIPESWVAGLVGSNTISSNFLAAVAGAFMYFATLTEVPILEGLLASGMATGPALALLLAGPAVSLPNLLVINSVLGIKKTAVFFCLVVVLSTAVGYLFGIFFI